MHVCVLSDGYPPWEHGGAQKIAAQLARGYSRRGHRVSVLTAVTERGQVGVSTVDGAEVYRIYSPKPKALLPYLTEYNPFVARPARRVLDEMAPDVVHAHNCHWLSNATIQAAADGRPVVKTYHDAGTFAYGDFDGFVERVPIGRDQIPKDVYEVRARQQVAEQRLRYNPLRTLSNRRCLRRNVDVGVAVSRELQRALLANGMPCQDVIRNGVDPDDWCDGDGDSFRREHGVGDARIVLFGGRTSETKGGRHLASAIARLSADPAVQIVVTGDERFADEMRREMGSASDRLTVTGWIDSESYRDAMDAATVVASPSVYLDPFPTVNLEAFAASTPVITTRFGGGSELVDHGVNGFVVDPRDERALTEALETLLEDPELASAFGDAGRRTVAKTFGLEKQVDTYLERLNTESDSSYRTATLCDNLGNTPLTR